MMVNLFFKFIALLFRKNHVLIYLSKYFDVFNLVMNEVELGHEVLLGSSECLEKILLLYFTVAGYRQIILSDIKIIGSTTATSGHIVNN